MSKDAGALIRRARERKSLTIKALADAIGEDDGALSRLERGGVVYPPAAGACAVAAYARASSAVVPSTAA